MSEPGAGVSHAFLARVVLAASAVVGSLVPVAPVATGAALLAASADPRALLLRADRVRAAWREARLVLRIVTTRPGAPEQRGDFEVLVKGEKARISFLEPADAGKALYVSGEDAWLVLPTARNPIRIPRSHRLTGGFSAGDVAFTRYAEDYDALWERADVLDGRACDVLRLMARRDRHPPFPVLRVWIDRKEGLTRKVVFLLPSGITFSVLPIIVFVTQWFRQNARLLPGGSRLDRADQRVPAGKHHRDVDRAALRSRGAGTSSGSTRSPPQAPRREPRVGVLLFDVLRRHRHGQHPGVGALSHLGGRRPCSGAR